jgi:hypothetical protein
MVIEKISHIYCKITFGLASQDDILFIKENMDFILNDSYLSRTYPIVFRMKRFTEGEEAISRSAMNSYLYATDTLKGRFVFGEEAIAKDPRYSYHYAEDILKGRFILSEKLIYDSFYKDHYVNFLENN